MEVQRARHRPDDFARIGDGRRVRHDWRWQAHALAESKRRVEALYEELARPARSWLSTSQHQLEAEKYDLSTFA